jgi:alpha-tubulin suppressor-like RCC1 family protein
MFTTFPVLRKLRSWLWLLVVLTGFGQSYGAEGNYLIFGDWCTGSSSQRKARDGMKAYMARTGVEFDAALCMGDNFYTPLTGVNDPKWQSYFETIYDPAIFNFPFHVVLGNHDYADNNVQHQLNYSKTFPNSRWKMPAKWYRLDLPSATNPLVTYLMVDTDDQSGLTTQEMNDQTAWLQAQLANRTAKWVAVVGHHTLYNHNSRMSVSLRNRWGPLLQQYKVDFYLCGHDHSQQNIVMPGLWTSFVIQGAGGAALHAITSSSPGPFGLPLLGAGHLKLTDTKAHVTFFDEAGKEIHVFERILATGAVNVLSPTVDAGPLQTAELGKVATLSGTATDDGQPSNTLSYSWTQVGGPTATIANPNSLTTGVSFSAAGNCDFQLKVGDGLYWGVDRVRVVVVSGNSAPIVNAGSDQAITLPNVVSLNGSYADDGLPQNATVTKTWSKVSGPGTVSFANASALSTSASFSVEGSYVLRLTVSDSQLSGSDTLTVSVSGGGSINQSPTVSAGSDQTITLPSSANLSGTVSDDGLPNPPAATTKTWSQVSGPGTVSFSNASSASTTASFSVEGSYVLRLTANDGAFAKSDDVTIVVQSAPPPTSSDGGGLLAGGSSHSLGLRSDGRVLSWGANAHGQLGLGHTNQVWTPTLIGTLGNVIDVSAGRLHSLVLKTDQTLWGFGHNGYGQLGVGSSTLNTSPIQIMSGVISIAAGYQHSLAVKNDGSAWAWGYGSYGQIGNGTQTKEQLFPVRISNLTAINSVSAGGNHSIAVKSDGTVWAWGFNEYGQLGLGYTNRVEVTPKQTLLSDVKRVAAGVSFTVALKNDGTVWTFGRNLSGQLGNGSTYQSATPVKVDLSGVEDIAVTAEGSHTLALKKDGTVWGWGGNSSGQLGAGVTKQLRPIQVANLTQVSSIAAGSAYSMAMKQDGTVWVLGNNASGQLGLGHTNKVTTATQVPGVDLLP